MYADTPARRGFSQHAQSLAVLAGLVEGDAARDLIVRAADDPKLWSWVIFPKGFRAPANKTLLLLANGLLAKRGLRKARRAGRMPARASN